MARLTSKIKEYCKENGIENINFLEDVILQNDGDGDYIKEWNLDISKPTNSQLDNLENEADTRETSEQIIETRKRLYGSWESQLEEINEQGLDAWKERIAQIKADNPKES
tara:strand:- start:49 stop:378 length:330 start_codon:yes stop_codon:yes gene_type:complete